MASTSLQERGPPSAAAVAIGTALISGIMGYFLGQARSIGFFTILPALNPDRPNAHRRRRRRTRTSTDHTDDSSSSDPSHPLTDDDDDDDGDAQIKSFPGNDEDCKLVLVVRADLGMTKGKIAAQCSHATLACYKAFVRADPRHPILKRWEERGQAKVALKVNSEDEMLTIQAQALSLGLCAQVIHDAGRTQIASGSATVVGIGPAPISKINEVTGDLKLL